MSDISNYLNELRKAIGVYSLKYDKILLMEDFNIKFSHSVITVFCDLFHLKGLINAYLFYNP